MNKVLLALSFVLAAGSLQARTYQQIKAKVGNEIVTTGDVEEQVNLLKLSMSPAELATKDGKQRLEEARKEILDRMIEEKLVVAAAQKGPEGFADAVESGRAIKNPFLPAETEVDAQMEQTFEQTRSRFGTQKKFEEELARERITVRELRQRLRERIRDRLTYEKMINIKKAEYRQQVRVSDEEAEEFYKEEKGQFAVADQVRLRHILVDEADAKLARDIKNRLENGEAFAKLAERYSKDKATAKQGGRLDWVEKGQLRWPQLEKVAFNTKTGRIGGPVKTGEGWHVIRVDDRKAGFQQDFEDVKTKIKNMLYAKKISDRIVDWMQSLRQENYVEVLD